jgi:hypothetical protein
VKEEQKVVWEDMKKMIEQWPQITLLYYRQHHYPLQLPGNNRSTEAASREQRVQPEMARGERRLPGG